MSALLTKAKDQDDDDDFWGGLGAEFFGINDDAEGKDELMKGLLADDDNDFEENEVSQGKDSFDSDFAHPEENSDKGGVDEDEVLEKEEKAAKKKKFAGIPPQKKKREVKFEKKDKKEKEQQIEEEPRNLRKSQRIKEDEVVPVSIEKEKEKEKEPPKEKP